VSTLADGDDHISLTAQQSRFGIKSKIDTAIGQIRTQIEADFNGTATLVRTPSPASASRCWSLGHDPELDVHGWSVLVHRGPAADRRIHG
jgi:sensor domain CHASE-containing protein